MSEPHPLPARLQPQRDRVIQTLCEHFAVDHLSAEELEQRLDLAHRATSLAELEALTTDLPSLASATGVAAEATRALARPEEVDATGIVLAVMGGAERRGVWTPPRQLNVLAVMGGVELDFREARLSPGVTELNVLALMGGVEILVPPGVRVESAVIPIMGGVNSRGVGSTAGPGAPVLRLRGLALMGGIDVRERLPGESGTDARRRLRDERREQKRLRRGA
jgi:hypothetical protein